MWYPITGIGFTQTCAYWSDLSWVQFCYLFSAQPRLQQAEEEIEKLKKVEPLLRKELDTCQEVNLFLLGFVCLFFNTHNFTQTIHVCGKKQVFQ